MSGYVLEASGVSVRFGGVRATDRGGPGDPGGRGVRADRTNGAGKTTLFDVLSGIRRPTGSERWTGGHHAPLPRVAGPAGHAPDVSARAVVRSAQRGRQRAGGAWSGGAAGGAWPPTWSPFRGGGPGSGRAAPAASGCWTTAASARSGAPEPGLARRAGTGWSSRAGGGRPPRVLLLDEPASGMSAPERERLAAVVRRLAEEEGCAVLLVEHNVAFVMDLCTRVVVLDLGTVLAEGTPAGYGRTRWCGRRTSGPPKSSLPDPA